MKGGSMKNKHICIEDRKTLKKQCYCRKCRNDYMKRYRKQCKKPYVYMIHNGNKVQYVGKSWLINDRISNHVNGHVLSTQRVFKRGRWIEIKAMDVSEIVNNDMELKILENELIEMYKPKYNKVINRVQGIDRLKELKLCCKLYEQMEWETIKKNTK